ncbi:hypothetical protein MCOR27_008496 [Pyricularia oryzae]|uniref:Uncharacterized protein n=5 Tax=Pyricularia TaxID=48558 RepID=A0ABQ8NGD1_PYRGI|nr:uncharacterized protein MGG_15740 [Pyricularia oryzae 70-15]ELQ43249.1 hypothetical protein OOU_Y34scaffold00162g18 [Pyricularia oryzae Y34]KAI6272112.1 hypothetical protein MCOR27_008496 [Pyricularia oryzae]KAI6296538.1 hypothetical protein MCOR33_006887 [Pyricularia grisea]EHA54792.1 hypothetical protein MGG_15740 [Pyricularia oryzae 70-15]KAI6287170.1 hypothetical protein MCOR26_000719 [Pyricularia oryzae]
MQCTAGTGPTRDLRSGFWQADAQASSTARRERWLENQAQECRQVNEARHVAGSADRRTSAPGATGWGSLNPMSDR